LDSRDLVPLGIGILASGTGSNAEAIADAIEAGKLDARIRVLISNRAEAPVLEKAARRGLPTRVIDHGVFPSREDFDAAVAKALHEFGVDLVVMAGFDRIVTKALLDAFPNRVLNIHPALLPAFRGANAQEQATAHGVTIAGATVHLVDEAVDHGPIIVQVAVPVSPEEDTETVRRRILAQEHRIYVHAIQWFAEERVRVVGRKAIIEGRAPIGTEALVSPPLRT
jgi:phosphoribosylglycinamide formyltransferase-1